MNCIAIDDEPLALQLLQDNISKVPFLNLIAACSDAFEAMTVIQNQPIDLMFIDIQMPGLSGLQLIKSMDKKPLVIFITAYKEHALESYELDVVDYLLKPVPFERFLKSCLRAKERFEQNVVSYKSALPQRDHFFVNADYSQIKITMDDIFYIESLGDYLKIHLKSTTKPVITRSTFKGILEELPENQFVRIHKSFVVAAKEITAVRKNSIFLGDLEFSVGESFKDAIDKILKG